MAGNTEIKNFSKELGIIAKNVDELEKSLTNLINEFVQLNNTVKSGQATQKETSRNTKKLTDLEKERARVTSETRKIIAKTTSLQEKETKELIKRQIELREARKKTRAEAEKELGLTKQQTSFTDKLSKSYQNAALKIGLVVGAITAVIKGISAYARESKELNKQTRQTADTFSLNREEARKLTKEIRVLSSAFDQEFNDVLKSARILSNEFGITATEALNLINEGFEKGADVNGEFLELLKEYPAQLKSVGFSAEQTIAIITQTERAGVFSDKGIDAIKEAGLRLRELTPAAKKALDDIGLSSKEIEKSLKEGSKSLFDVTKEVSKKLSELPPQSKVVGQAIADIFGGPGEDVGLTFLTTLKDIDIELGNVKSNITESEQAQINLNKAIEIFKTNAMDASTVIGGVYTKLIKLLSDAIIEFANLDLIFTRSANLTEEQVSRTFDLLNILNTETGVSFRAVITELDKLSNEQVANNKKAISQMLQDVGFTVGESIQLYDEYYGRRYEQMQQEAIEAKKRLEEIAKGNDQVIRSEQNNAKKTKEIFDEKQDYFESIKVEEIEANEMANEAIILSNAMMHQILNEADKEGLEAFRETVNEKIKKLDEENEAILKQAELQKQVENDVNQAKIDIVNQTFEFVKTLGDLQLSHLEDRLAKGLITQKQFDRKSADIKRKQAIADKAQGVFNAIINTREAVTSALALGPVGIPLAILMGVLGGLQVATIVAQPIPKFKHGSGVLQEDTLAWVGDGGVSEVIKTADNKYYQTPAKDTLVNLPKGSQVYPSVENFVNMMGGIDNNKMDELIDVSKKNKKTEIMVKVNLPNYNARSIEKYFRN